MNFSNLLLRNFRSIGREGVTVRFSDEQNLATPAEATASGKSAAGRAGAP